MSMLPRVTDPTRERVSREFDNLGPEVCMVDIRKDLDRHNPQLLDMAMKWAGEGNEGKKLFTAFGMFYRLLAAEASAPLESNALSPLPQVSSETRDRIVARISWIGDEQFCREAIGILKPQIQNSCKWRMALRRGDPTTCERCRDSPCFMRRSSSRRRAIGSSLISGAHTSARSRKIGNLTTVKALWLPPA
jgi:hypothetical protein